jgi:fumarate hydratase class II
LVENIFIARPFQWVHRRHRVPKAWILALQHGISRATNVCTRTTHRLEVKVFGAIRRAAQEVMNRKLGGEFVVDIFQTGSGTLATMNFATPQC